MKKISNFLKAIEFGTLFTALVCTTLGVALLVTRDTASMIVCFVFGIILIANALVQLVMCFKDNTYATGKSILMFSSLIMAVIGAWMLKAPEDISSTIIFVILGVILLYHGITDMKFSSYLKMAKHKLWYVALIIGFITIGCGVLCLVAFNEEWLYIATAVSLIFDGLSDIWIIWILAATRRGTSKMTAEIETTATTDLTTTD